MSFRHSVLVDWEPRQTARETYKPLSPCCDGDGYELLRAVAPHFIPPNARHEWTRPGHVELRSYRFMPASAGTRSVKLTPTKSPTITAISMIGLLD